MSCENCKRLEEMYIEDVSKLNSEISDLSQEVEKWKNLALADASDGDRKSDKGKSIRHV